MTSSEREGRARARAERRVLAGLLGGGRRMAWLASFLGPEDFAFGWHRGMFLAARESLELDGGATPDAVAEILRGRGALPAWGGEEDLRALARLPFGDVRAWAEVLQSRAVASPVPDEALLAERAWREAPKGRTESLETGVAALDGLTGGLPRGALTAIGCRRGAWSAALALEVARRASGRGLRVRFATLRPACIRAMAGMEGAPGWLTARAGVDVGVLIQELMDAGDGSADVVMVDGVELLGAGSVGGGEDSGLARTASRFRRLAEESGSAVVVTCRLRRPTPGGPASWPSLACLPHALAAEAGMALLAHRDAASPDETGEPVPMRLLAARKGEGVVGASAGFGLNVKRTGL